MPSVVYLGYPARGHTSPSMPVVAELVRRGVEVDYHCTPAFRTLVEDAGARFVAYPPACDHWLTTPVGSGELLARCVKTAQEMMPPLLAALEPAPDLILFDASAVWGGILARLVGCPSIASITTFAFNRPMLRLLNPAKPAAWAAPAFEHLNASYGANLRDHLDLIVPVADLKFVYTSRSFQPSGRFFDDSHIFLGPLLDERLRDGEQVQASGSRPLAYVSLGTIFNRDQALLFQISEVLAARGWEVVVSLGGAAPNAPRTWPEHVRAYGFVDQIGVLAQAQLFVSHGGMNSVSEALSQAVPMIIIPQAVDQHMVARHTANLGAGVVIEPDAVSAQTLCTALARLQDNRAAFRAAAARLQKSLADVVSISDAVDRALALILPEQSHA